MKNAIPAIQSSEKLPRFGKKYKYMHSMDCFLYAILCECGEEIGAWTPEAAEREWEKHVCKEPRTTTDSKKNKK